MNLTRVGAGAGHRRRDVAPSKVAVQVMPGVGPTMAGPRPTTVAGRKCQMIADLNWRAIGLLTAEAYANGRLTELE